MIRKTTLAILAILVLVLSVMIHRTNNRFELNTENAASNQDQMVQALLDQNRYGEPYSTEDLEWRFVTVVNLKPLIQEFGNGWQELAFGDECGIGIVKGDENGSGLGSIRARGSVGQRTLYEFTKEIGRAHV